jgi:iron complex outermembrane receptor protein
MKKSTILLYAGASWIAFGALGSAPALAQSNTSEQAEPAGVAPQAGTMSEASTQEIVVTGSRLGSSGFSAPTPVTVVGAAEIARQGATSITEVLNQVPAFRAQNTPTTSANFASNLGASTADLRGLGANRTLVLLNGRRVVAATVQGGSTTPANAVDLGMFPTALISRSEVVTGGASAQYGSDAVAGVVNIILDTKLQGFRGSAQYGQTDHNDAKEYAASVGWGTNLGERGHIVVGGDYTRSLGTGDCYTRDWCAVGINTVTAPASARGGSVAAINLLPNTTTATASYSGLINAGPLSGTEFANDGLSTFRHNYGTFYGSGLFQSGGGDGKDAFYQNFALSVRLRRYALFGHVNYELTDKVSAFAEFSYADSHGRNPTSQNRDTNIVIRNDNPYLPSTLLAAMAANNLTTFTMGRIGQDFGPAMGEVSRDTMRAVGGLEGRLGNELRWNIYYQYGRTNYHQATSNDKINDRYLTAIDAVRGASGNIVCRINADAIATNDDPACVPLNIFGQNNWSSQARDYAFGTATQTTHISQHVVAAELSGNLVDLWAGPLSFAAGGEYREDSANGSADPISSALRFFTNSGAAIAGKGSSVRPYARSERCNTAHRLLGERLGHDVESWRCLGTCASVASAPYAVSRYPGAQHLRALRPTANLFPIGARSGEGQCAGSAAGSTRRKQRAPARGRKHSHRRGRVAARFLGTEPASTFRRLLPDQIGERDLDPGRATHSQPVRSRSDAIVCPGGTR